MRPAVYFVVVALLVMVAWQFPFLFELPLIAAVGGIWWAFFAGRSGPEATGHSNRQAEENT